MVSATAGDDDACVLATTGDEMSDHTVVHSWWERYRRRATIVGVLAVVLMPAAYYGAVWWGFRTREVGPDADEMANDPVLHLDIDQAAPSEIQARTGHEGGPMPAMANDTSVARRRWTLVADDWQATLLTTIEQINDEGVTWSRLSCSRLGVTLRGQKDVAVHDDLVPAWIGVYLNRDDPPMLSIELESDGDSITVPNSADREPLGDCPPAIADTFSALAG